MTPPRPPLSDRSPTRDRVHVAIVINQLATPGMGSWIAGRRAAGAGQLTIALAGFGLFVAHFATLIVQSVRALGSGIEPEAPSGALWRWGIVLFAIAWVWSGVTSVQLWREARNRSADAGAAGAGMVPPRLGQ